MFTSQQSLLCRFLVVSLLALGIELLLLFPRQQDATDIVQSVRAKSESIASSRRLVEDTAPSAGNLFNPTSFTVLGPSVFPKPSAVVGKDALPNLLPTYGRHRPDADSVFAFAAEYDLNTFICFVKSLRRTGFTGDVVLAISILDIQGKGVKEFFTNEKHVVVYVLELKCFTAEMQATTSVKGGVRVCQLHNLFANASGVPQNDPREPRTVATTRYELYWLWCLHYNPNVWIMLIDARDSYFQTNPFHDLPRDTDTKKKSGALYFFGENTNATRIGQSVQNRKWLTRAYGEAVATALEDKPTICSGSTMGEQVAVEAYLRSMVGESDETGTKLAGADQGFHNYLYYSKKLGNAKSIASITVFDQGWGIINNLGAMRKAPLESWGNGKILEYQSVSNMTILNWDGSISPVVHQFDRHPILSKFVYKYQTEMLREAFYAALTSALKQA